jgi:hypothetical protein
MDADDLPLATLRVDLAEDAAATGPDEDLSRDAAASPDFVPDAEAIERREGIR